MIPRYALLKLEQRPRLAWIADDTHARWWLILDDGGEWYGAPARLLYRWEGLPLPDGPPAELRAAALAQLAQQARPAEAAPGDGAAPEVDLEALWRELPPGEGVAFETIAAMALGESALGEGAGGWARARLYLALLGESGRFRSTRRGFVARRPVEIHQRQERAREESERQSWLEKAKGWRERLESGRWEEAGEEGRRFIAQLESLIVHERQSPHWKLLAGTLGLHLHHWVENRVILKRWLETAGVWRGWGNVWLARAEVPPTFDPELEALAGAMAAQPLEPAGRVDYRGEETYTFDSPHTRDFDDGCTLLGAEGDALLVAVHVAEPAPALAPGHPLFEEAARRMYSVYTVEGIFPMLPEPLSNGRFALVEGQEREAITFRLRVGPRDGELLGIERSLVRVRRNLDYESGTGLLAESSRGWGRLARLAESLAAARAERGAYLVDRSEVMIDASDPRRIGLTRYDRQGPIHRLVEELAVLANREAGRYCQRHGLPAFYRVQPRPRGSNSLGTAFGAARNRIVPIQAARFSLEGDLHAGLACDRYVQVTSPIRRFTDLVMQRQIASHLLHGRPAFTASGLLEGWMERAEQRGSTYIEVERRIDDEWKRRYLSQHPGLELMGEVRKRGSTQPGRERPARVWLEEVLLEAEAELPEAMAEGMRARFRLARVDHDRCTVWVERV